MSWNMYHPSGITICEENLYLLTPWRVKFEKRDLQYRNKNVAVSLHMKLFLRLSDSAKKTMKKWYMTLWQFPCTVNEDRSKNICLIISRASVFRSFHWLVQVCIRGHCGTKSGRIQDGKSLNPFFKLLQDNWNYLGFKNIVRYVRKFHGRTAKNPVSILLEFQTQT